MAENDTQNQDQPKDAANLPAATAVSTSGAPVQVVPDVDLSHPAVDDNPRARTSVTQNAIDFNDPTVPGHQAVAEALTAQGVPTEDVPQPGEEQADARKTTKRGSK